MVLIGGTVSKGKKMVHYTNVAWDQYRAYSGITSVLVRLGIVSHEDRVEFMSEYGGIYERK